MNAQQEQASTPASMNESGWFDREVSWLRSEARWFVLAVLSALIVDLVIVGAFSTGPINVFHNDALLLLDDGWRVLQGQTPHRDFNSPLGPLEFWIVGLGMVLTRGSAQGIAIGIAIFGLVLGTWSWLLCRTRMPAFFATLATAWIVFTATCPTPLGFDPRFLSCAMIYNRQGYALLGIILVDCAFAYDRGSLRSGISSGIALVLLAFLKLNFFGIGALLLIATIPVRRGQLSRFHGVLLGTAAASLAFAVYLRFSLGAFLADMAFVGRARGSTLQISGLVHGTVTCAKSGSFWLVVALTVVLIAFANGAQRGQFHTVRTLLLSGVVLASGPLFLETNTLEDRAQLALLWIIILLDRVSALHLRTKENKVVTLVMMAACLGAIAADLMPEVSSSLLLLRYQSATRKREALRIAAPGMERMAFYNSTPFYDKVRGGDGDGSFYVECLNDGMTLLKSRSKPDETILALGFHNPFSYLLRRKAANGGSSYLFMGNSMSESEMPPVEWVFGNADLMMLPEYEGTHHASDEFIQNYYREYLMKNFRFVARSQYWSLYRRNR